MLLEHLNPRAILLALSLSAAWQATLGASSFNGLSETDLVQEIGLPQSKLRYQDNTIYHYPGYTYTLRDNHVISSQPNQLQDIETVERTIAAKRSETSERQRDRYRNSTELSHLRPAGLREFWLRFQQLYPEIVVSEEIAAAELAMERQERLRLEAEVDELKETIANMRSTPRSVYRYGGYGYRGFRGHPYYNRHPKRVGNDEARIEPAPVDRAALITKTQPLPNNTHRFRIPPIQPVTPLVR